MARWRRVATLAFGTGAMAVGAATTSGRAALYLAVAAVAGLVLVASIGAVTWCWTVNKVYENGRQDGRLPTIEQYLGWQEKSDIQLQLFDLPKGIPRRARRP
jgi:hypothetical protein